MATYEEKKGRVADLLRSVGSKISLTLDFVPLESEHMDEKLCEALVATCEWFGILPSILGIATDNASNLEKLLSCF